MKKQLLFFALLVPISFSCEENNVEKSCIEPPCGEIQQGVVNFTVIPTNFDLEGLSLKIGEETVVIDLTELETDGSHYSCWQVVTSNQISSATVTIQDAIVTVPVEGAIQSDALVLSLQQKDGALVAALSDWSPCNDTPTASIF